MDVAPRTGLAAVAHIRGEHRNPTRDWTRLCQMATRTAFGLGPHFGTAIAQWRGTPRGLRHDDRDPAYGSAGFFSSPIPRQPGHAVVIGKGDHLWSNDIKAAGVISLTTIGAIEDRWGYRWEGWTETVNLHRILGHGPSLSAGSIARAQLGDREHAHGELLKRQLAAVPGIGRHGMRFDDHLGEPLGDAVKDLQGRLGLKRTGVVGPRLLGWLADHDHAFTARP